MHPALDIDDPMDRLTALALALKLDELARVAPVQKLMNRYPDSIRSDPDACARLIRQLLRQPLDAERRTRNFAFETRIAREILDLHGELLDRPAGKDTNHYGSE